VLYAFYAAGALLALWALVVSALGLTRRTFPGARGGERVVTAISIVLTIGAIATAVLAGALEEEEPAAGSEETGGQEGGEAAPTAAGTRLELSADPAGGLSFVEGGLVAPAGRIEIVMRNPASIPHNVSLEGNGLDEQGRTVGMGATSTVAADVEPGEYVFYCSVGGHREGGMEGTLTVE